MFPNPPQAPTLNAIPPTPPDLTQAQHRAENLAACLEMRDLGLKLARAAAARALAAHEQTQTPEAAPEPATPNTAQAAKPTDPDLAFARHSRSVRQSVELWEKITNNSFARHPQSPRQTWSESPDFDPDLDGILSDDETTPYSEADRGNLYEAVANLSLISPAHEAIPETLNHTIEETLAAHPTDHLSTNFARICQAYNITPDRTRLQPHLESQLRPPTSWPKLE